MKRLEFTTLTRNQNHSMASQEQVLAINNLDITTNNLVIANNLDTTNSTLVTASHMVDTANNQLGSNHLLNSK